MPTLVANGLQKKYKTRVAVKNVSITVESGQIVGLLGPNGAGKTTSFYMIVGLVLPDRGTIKIDQHDVTRLPIHARARLGIGYLPQEKSYSKYRCGGEFNIVKENMQNLVKERNKLGLIKPKIIWKMGNSLI